MTEVQQREKGMFRPNHISSLVRTLPLPSAARSSGQQRPLYTQPAVADAIKQRREKMEAEEAGQKCGTPAMQIPAALNDASMGEDDEPTAAASVGTRYGETPPEVRMLFPFPFMV